MAAKLTLDTGSLPKSTAGRKAIQPDADLVAALVEFFGKGTLDDNGRPVFAGPTTDYDTEGKASSAGRRHAVAVQEVIGMKVRVNINQLGDDGPFRWRVYVPKSETDRNDTENTQES